MVTKAGLRSDPNERPRYSPMRWSGKSGHNHSASTRPGSLEGPGAQSRECTVRLTTESQVYHLTHPHTSTGSNLSQVLDSPSPPNIETPKIKGNFRKCLKPPTVNPVLSHAWGGSRWHSHFWDKGCDSGKNKRKPNRLPQEWVQQGQELRREGTRDWGHQWPF